jgi:excisionase family DNA binding protein
MIRNGISCAEAAALLGCSRPHVSHLIATGELTAERVVGRIMLVNPASVRAYAKNPKRRSRSPAKAVKKTSRRKSRG